MLLYRLMHHHDGFNIYIDQLRDGHVERIKEELSPDFLDIEEKDLKFNKDVQIGGEAYLTKNELILHLDVDAEAQVPCVICTTPVNAGIHIKGSYQAIPLSEIKSGVFNFRDLLREVILLESPRFAECQGEGNCPERKEIGKYLKKEQKADKTGEESTYRPFKDL